MFRPTILITCLAGALLLAAAAPAQTARVTLVYDDSRNPMPFLKLYYTCNWDPQSGRYEKNWRDFVRLPMHDDGLHGDGAAGDRIWGVEVNVMPNPGQLFEWAVDDDEIGENDWLGACNPFLVDTPEPKRVLTRSMPDEAYQGAEAFAAANGVDLSQPAAPRRLAGSDRVLFTVNAPDARYVYLAGSFNNWARNRDGVITDPRCMMLPAGNGNWFRVVSIPEATATFKYVAVDAAGNQKWFGDPRVPAADADGNTMLRTPDLPEVAAKPRPPAAEGAARWVPYSRFTAQQVLAESGRVLVYVRMADNARCREFEQEFLLGANIAPGLAGQTLLFADAADPAIRDDLRGMGVVRVPALAWRSRTADWQSMLYGDGEPAEKVTMFVAAFANSK